jgi:DNA-directed RNA polymerase subunit D
LDKDQEIEIVARARVGTGLEHAKFLPGLVFYRHLPKIKISKEGESCLELSELFPKVFSFDNKLKVKDASSFELDSEDLAEYPGVEVSFDDSLVFVVESWGQMNVKDILLESCKVLKGNLGELSKVIK